MTTTNPNTRLPDFPEHPHDGYEIKQELPDGGYVQWAYHAVHNSWTSRIFTAYNSGYVYTDQVLTRGDAPPWARDGEDIPELLTQRDVNWYLNENGGGGGDDGLLVRVEELEADQGRQDKDLEDYKAEVLTDQQRQDKDLADYKVEVSTDQQRQDKDLEEYKVEVLTDQQRQDKELADYKVLIAKEQQDQNKAISDEQSARVDADAAHDAQLNTIEFKLDALVGLQFKGVYTFKHDTDCDAAYAACMAAAGGDIDASQQCGRDMLNCENGKVASGTFEAVDPDDRFDHLQAIVIHKNAIDGEELEWDEILKAGDYLEVDHRGADGLDKQNYGLYRLTADPVEATNAAGEPVFDMELVFLQGEGVLAVDENYEVRGITATEGISPEELGDFLLKDEAANTYALKTHTHDNYITKEADNSTYKDWLLLADGNKKSPTSYAGANHAHGWTEITGKPATYAPAPHSHDYAGKDHGHGWTDITGKPSTYPPSSHTHSYASTNHNHNSDYVKGNYTISKDSSGNYYIQ